jgi:hypothetical protein
MEDHHMSDFIKCDIDMSQFTRMLHELKDSVPSANEVDIIRNEVGKVLERAEQLTGSASVSKIKQRSDNAKFTAYQGRVYSLKNKYPNSLWQAIRKKRADDLAKKLHARGLAKQSWVLIANKLGIPIRAPQYVLRAVATTGRTYYEDVSTTEHYDDRKIEISIENNQPTINAIGGSGILEMAIAGRVKFYFQNLSHGVFMSLDKIAKKYPGIVTKETYGS